MKAVLRFIKQIWFFSFLRRIWDASKTVNYKYGQIFRWGFRSREYTNYTYDLTDRSLTYMTFALAAALGKDYDTIRGFIQELQDDTALKDHIVQQTRLSPHRKFADTEVRFARRLGWYAVVRVIKPKLVIETGVDKGMGAVVLCAALLKNREEGFPGQYLGTDINPEAGYLLSGKYAEVGKILYGDSIESLSAIQEPIDLFINDSDHSVEYEYREYQTIKKRLTDTSVILGDNSAVSSALVNFSLETGRRFLFFREEPKDHWYPGEGIGISYPGA